MWDLETSRIGAPYIYDISSLRVNVRDQVSHMYKTKASIVAVYILIFMVLVSTTHIKGSEMIVLF